MKLLVVLLALAAGLWLWRSARQSPSVGQNNADPAKPARKGPQVMVACSLCKVHIPEGDALAGHNGRYCCAAHRLQAEP